MVAKIDYIEFESPDYQGTRDFFSKAFGWTYKEFGQDYCEIGDAGLTGGIAAMKKAAPPLVILKTDDLEGCLRDVEESGGVILQPIFSFPGGRRFHFREPGGSELAVWTEE